MTRQAIKPELTTRELYDIFHLRIDILEGLSVVLYNTKDLHIDYHAPGWVEGAPKELYVKAANKKIMSYLEYLNTLYILPPFESNFIDRSQL